MSVWDGRVARLWRLGIGLCTLVLAVVWTSACSNESCVTAGCPIEQVCQRETGQCVDARVPTCDCEQGFYCDPPSGRCLELIPCRSAEDCQDEGDCEVCTEGFVCNVQSGFCDPDGCQFVDCAVNQQCSPSTNECEDRPCATDTDCPTGTVCLQLTCELGCRISADCGEGKLCVRDDGQEVGVCNTLCEADEDCPWGQVCAQEEGQSRCVPEGPCVLDSDCRSGEECRQSTCKRGLCSDDTDCGPDEYCEVDAGECRADDCSLDQFEANDDAVSAVRLPLGSYAGLTLCGAEEDWYVVDSTSAVQLRLIYNRADADLDLEVYQGLEVIAQSSSGGFSETLTIPAHQIGEGALVRVFATSGRDTVYALSLREAPPMCGGDIGEPNDTPAMAATVEAETDLRNLSLCFGDTDIYAVSAPPTGGPLAIRVLPGVWPPPGGGGLSVGLTPPERQEVLLDPRDSLTGLHEVEFAYVESTAVFRLALASTSTLDWRLTTTSPDAECLDPTTGNNTLANPLLLDQEDEVGVRRRDGERLCPTPLREFEADWYEIAAADEAIRVEAAVTDQSDWQMSPIPTPTFALVTTEGAVLRVAQPLSAGTAALVATVSRATRPLYLRVTYDEGTLPSVVESWPTYGLTVRVSAAGSCVEEAGEGSGNDTLDTATPVLGGSYVGVLCDEGSDYLRIVVEDAAAPPIVSLGSDGPLDWSLWVETDVPTLLDSGSITEEEGGSDVVVYNGAALGEGTQALIVNLEASGRRPEGVLYSARVEE